MAADAVLCAASQHQEAIVHTAICHPIVAQNRAATTMAVLAALTIHEAAVLAALTIHEAAVLAAAPEVVVASVAAEAVAAAAEAFAVVVDKNL